jgi:hypothetical protein
VLLPTQAFSLPRFWRSNLLVGDLRSNQIAYPLIQLERNSGTETAENIRVSVRRETDLIGCYDGAQSRIEFYGGFAL